MSIREAILNEAKEQGLGQKERTVITRAWKKGYSVQEIAELADVSVERVESIIQELNQKKAEE